MSDPQLVNERFELHPLPIGRGGMGEVYLGRDVKLERKVAVKFLRIPRGQPDDELLRRFVRESRITARLEHPGVPAVYDVGVHENRPYIVMQYVEGVSLNDLIAEEGALPIGWAAAIAAQIAAVLATAHRASLIHRDLKPANLIMTSDCAVKVLDFGLAAALGLDDFSRITHTGQPLGTPSYMAPEQIEAGHADPRTDLYALGCVLFELLTGQHVFEGASAFTVMQRHVSAPAPAVRSLRAEVPTGLADLVIALLEKKPDDRPTNAVAVYESLMPFVKDLGPAPAALNAATSPSGLRLYATVLGRLSGRSDPPELHAPPRPLSDQKPINARADLPSPPRQQLASARAEVTRLLNDSRYTEASEVIGKILPRATEDLGPLAGPIVDMRRQLADALFAAGEYRIAHPEFTRLAADLSGAGRADDELALHCRRQAATCEALGGDATAALEHLHELLADRIRLYGAHDAQTLDVRRQIGLLQLGAGDDRSAAGTLTDLVADLRRLRGRGHPDVVRVEEVLGRIAARRS